MNECGRTNRKECKGGGVVFNIKIKEYHRPWVEKKKGEKKEREKKRERKKKREIIVIRRRIEAERRAEIPYAASPLVPYS